MGSKWLLAVVFAGLTGYTNAQTPGIPQIGTTPLAASEYRATAEKQFNLQHTKLELSFDYTQARMPGKAWLTLTPHFYPAQTLRLDAKGMIINKVALVKGKQLTELMYDYPDEQQLVIMLDRQYNAGEPITVYIDYVARPNELKVKGSVAITDAKGLYFINPTGKDSTKPIQIWTQGETEATSVWCPTIDRTNQKTTQEISMRVPSKYVTLSNGILAKQTKHADGTRTDTWKMDLPHSPYLFFMGVGDYAVVRDKYKKLPVDYYVEPRWEPVARQIFGDTPDMIAFFERILGVSYPWPKYAQIVGRDYVSGAMENTTATLHGTAAYQNARQLTDENRWEIVVAHELFHQWFGDLVTAESWSNLTVNESFADYSEYLWLEYKYGKDHAMAYSNDAANAYLGRPGNKNKHLVRFKYADKEDMFDAVSYQKGGRILHMLRQYVGDQAFFAGLQLYLNTNKFKNTEATHVRLAMEEVSGKDLTWFFNQWFFGNSHPKVNIDYRYNDTAKKMAVIVTQLQTDKLFYMPLDIDLYENDKAERHTVWMEGPSDTFYLPSNQKPAWINVDAGKTMLWEKSDHQPKEAWLAQARLGKNYTDRYEALSYMAAHYDSSEAMASAIAQSLTDPYFGIRKQALNFYLKTGIQPNESSLATIQKIAVQDANRPTRAAAIDVLGMTGNMAYTSLFEKAVYDSSYTVAGAAMEALLNQDPARALALAPVQQKDALGRLKTSLLVASYMQKDTASYAQVLEDYKKLGPLEKWQHATGMLQYANSLQSPEAFKKIAGPVIDMYQAMRSDMGGVKTQIGRKIGWLKMQKQKELNAHPNNEPIVNQLNYLIEKTAKP